MWIYNLIVLVLSCNYAECIVKSVTTASGTFARKDGYFSGELIFEDNFNELNFRKWQHEITLTGSAVSTKQN